MSRKLSQKGTDLMRKLMLLCFAFALVLGGEAVRAGGLEAPYCDCEICAADGDQTCEDPWAGVLRPCVTFYGIYCRG